MGSEMCRRDIITSFVISITTLIIKAPTPACIPFKIIAKAPLKLTENESTYDIKVNVQGGGFNGQAGAIRHAIARALLEVNPDYRQALKRAGFLTRDPRKKERYKYGQKKARKSSQFSKR